MKNAAIAAEAVTRETTQGVLKHLYWAGFVDITGAPPVLTARRGFKMREKETVAAFAERVIQTFPHLEDGNLATFRDALAAARQLRNLRLPYDRLDQLAAIAAAQTNIRIYKLSAEDLLGALPGDRHHVASYVRDRQRRTYTACIKKTAIAAELGVAYDSIRHFVGLGLLKEDRLGFRIWGYDILPGNIREELTKRFWSIPRRRFSIGLAGHYASCRELLGISPHSTHPPGILDGTIDFLIENGQEAGTSNIFELLSGDRVAIREHLKQRHRNVGDVPYPPKIGPGSIAFPLSKLEPLVPEILKTLPRCAFEKSGSAKEAPNSADIGAILAIEDQTLAAIAMTIALHGRTVSTLEFKTRRAMSSLRHLWKDLQGTNLQSRSAVGATLGTLKLLADTASEQERWLATRALGSWKFVVEVFADCLARGDLSVELHASLEKIAPVDPVASDTFYSLVDGISWHITTRRHNKRVADIDGLLENAKAFLPQLVRRREGTKAFRKKVHAAVDAAIEGGADPAKLTLEDTFEDQIVGSDGLTRSRFITYKVHAWQLVHQQLGKKAPQKSNLGKNFPWISTEHPWQADLFENRFAVEYVSCVYAGESHAPPPVWFEFHRDHVFWTPRNCTDEQFSIACQTGARLHLPPTFRTGRASGLGHFNPLVATLARAAYNHLGMCLLPLEEHNHAEAFGLYHVSMRLDEPLRSDEFAQFNLSGDDAVHDFDDEGTPFLAAMKAVTKGSIQQREFTPSPHTEEFADELLEITSQRRCGGAGLAKVRRYGWKEGKGPSHAAFLLAYGDMTLPNSALTAATMTLVAGIHSLTPHYLKYLWNRLAKLEGLPIEERQARQDHVDPATTIIYNPEIESDLAHTRKTKREIKDDERNLLLVLQGEACLTTADAHGHLVFEKRRLEAMIAAYETHNHNPGVRRCQEELVLVEQQIAQAGL